MSSSAEVYLDNIRLKEGDHEVFLAIYNRFNRRLYYFIRKFIADADIADDILHDAFLNLWNARHRINGKYPIENYLFRIARNLVFKYLRAQLRSAETMLDLTYFAEESKVCYDTVEQTVIEREYREIYALAVDKLPPQRKRIFVMAREEGLSHKEIAQFLNISPNTVKEHVSLAMKSIKDYLAKDHGVVLSLLIFLWNIYEL